MVIAVEWLERKKKDSKREFKHYRIVFNKGIYKALPDHLLMTREADSRAAASPEIKAFTGREYILLVQEPAVHHTHATPTWTLTHHLCKKKMFSTQSWRSLGLVLPRKQVPILQDYYQAVRSRRAPPVVTPNALWWMCYRVETYFKTITC